MYKCSDYVDDFLHRAENVLSGNRDPKAKKRTVDVILLEEAVAFLKYYRKVTPNDLINSPQL